MFENRSLHDEAARTQAPMFGAERPSADKADLMDLDGEQANTIHAAMIGNYLSEIDRHAENRTEMELDGRYYDHDPWTEEEKRILAERGQMASSFNVVATTINWLIGTERRGRMDYKVLPRQKRGQPAAERKSELLKYLGDVNRSEFAWSRAFADAMKVGVGWVESGWQAPDMGTVVFDRYESWRNILWDSYSQEDDLSDARYIFRTRWADLDDALMLFPHRAELLNRSINAPFRTGMLRSFGIDAYGDSMMDSVESNAHWAVGLNQAAGRQRLRLIECWFRKPAQVLVMQGGDFSGELFDKYSPGHLSEVDSGRASIIRRNKQRVFVAVMTPTGLLSLQASPYRHNRLPFTPVWCYRKGKDGQPYGMIRGLRTIQDHINKAASKAIYILSTNKVVMDQGAVPDIEAFREEVARPDAIIEKVPGKELVLNMERDLSQAHMQIMGQMIQLVQTVSGVTDDNVGRQTNAHSGKAIELRQNQGALATAEPFDNLMNARRQHGDKMLSLAEQFIPEEMEFRITTQRGGAQFVKINDTDETDITATRADFVISEQNWNPTLRMAKADMLAQLIQQLAPTFPQIGPMIIDLVTELMDLPNGEEITKRIRQVTGMKDPDEDPNRPLTPEEQELANAKKAEAEMAARQQAAAIGKLEADAALSKAKADQTMEAAVTARLAAMEKALTNIIAMVQVPQLVPQADALLAAATQPTGTPQMDPGAMPPQPPMPPPGAQMPPQAAPQPGF